MPTSAATMSEGSAVSQEHLLGSYASDQELAAGVADFLAPALDDDGVALVIATPPQHASFVDALAELGTDADTGRYVWMDADAVLRDLMREGAPDPHRFRLLCGWLVERHVASGHAVRVYGHLATLLWERGEVAAAMFLEGLWNDLAEELPFRLLCCYPTGLFGGSDEDARAESTLREAHSMTVQDAASER